MNFTRQSTSPIHAGEIISYKNVDLLRRFITEQGKILPRRLTGVTAKEQRQLAKAIKQAREDKNVKAIVFRINSGGGSALASDVIWRETILAKAEKPLIVSMGDYAASGGYYIACAADSILAHPTTLTGSIGVFGMVPNLKRFYKNKLGITFDTVNTIYYLTNFITMV